MTAEKFKNIVLSPLRFRIFLLIKLPMGLLAGLKGTEFTDEKCTISLKYRYLNKNPFRSLYFAVLSMAAEASTGLLSMYHINNSQKNVSMLVSHIEGNFLKKGTGHVHFTCTNGTELKNAIQKAITTSKPVTTTVKSVGRNENGKEVALFSVTWSFKLMS